MRNKNIFLTEILPWYEENKRRLPWRKARISAYEVWVSEVMLQQTQVARVIGFYKNFLKRFPDIQTLAETSWEEFLPYYEGLGYYARGRNMLATAKIITEKYGGKFPREKKSLMALPGVGEYTASALFSFAYGEPEIAFDTNFKKVFGTREKAEQVFKESGVPSGVFNSAVMDWGSKELLKKQSGKFASLAALPASGLRHRLGIQTSRSASPTRTHLTLHENHKKYFSLNPKKYEPFILPVNISTREQIKKYFLDTYGLKISVRPPHKKEKLGGKLFQHVNAQILLGHHKFFAFPSSKK